MKNQIFVPIEKNESAEASTLLKKALASANKIRSMLERILEQNNPNELLFSVKKIKGEVVSLYSELEAVDENLCFDSEILVNKSDITCTETKYIQEKKKECVGFLKDGCFYFKCGPVPGKQNFFKKNYIDNIPFYAKAIQKNISELIETYENESHRNFDYAALTNKIVHFVFVYPNTLNMPDSDNHNTTKLQNAVTEVLPMGDKGDNCTTILDSLIDTSCLSPYTLITVYPAGIHLTKEEILSTWKSNQM